MKVLKLTLENVEKIKNGTDNKLVKWVCDYIARKWDKFDDKKYIFLDVFKNGCVSGVCRDLVYYEQTKRFYEAYKYEINELIYECGCTDLSDLFGGDWDVHDPLALEGDNKNTLAWFGFEETLRNIASKFGIE